MVTHSLRIAVATPHQEPSIVSLAHAAARRGSLVRVYTTLHTARLQAALPHVPNAMLRRTLERQLSRRSFPGIPLELVRSLARLPQTMYTVALRMPRAHSLASWLLYDSKKRFDRAVSKAISAERLDAIVALNFSASATFQALHEVDALRVLNFIDSHPRYQNRYLRELCGLRDPHRELVFPEAIGRVENELELAELILVPSSFVARQLEAVGIPPEKVVTEPYGVDLSAFQPASDGERPSRTSSRRCLFVGQISYRKGVGVLLEAARRLRDRPVEFQLVGPMVSPEVVRRMPENVHWRGARVQEGITEVMRQVDFFILPSVEDAFGLVTLEAMASGLPVIVTGHVGASELVSNRKEGLIVPPGDVPALTGAIDELLENEDLRISMGRAARVRVEQGCSWKEYSERVLGRIEERASRRGEDVLSNSAP
jgi:glycosyltransferase involved in cell wall biosynthesis